MSAPRRLLLADDEPFARERLRMLLAAHPGWTVVAECEDGRSAVDALLRERPDLALLDIRMPELDGLEVAAAVRALGARAPAVIFVTAHETHALEAFGVRAVDYLLKPVNASRLADALARVGERAAPVAAEPPAGRRRRFLVRGVRGELTFVAAEEIEWIEARRNYARLHAGGTVHVVRETMRQLVDALDPERFARVHRSVIVNLARVRSARPHPAGGYVVRLESGTTLRASRSRGAILRTLGR